jgi:hypothetical protein
MAHNQQWESRLWFEQGLASEQGSFDHETTRIRGTAALVRDHTRFEPFLPPDAIGKSTCQETASSLVQGKVPKKWPLGQPVYASE